MTSVQPAVGLSASGPASGQWAGVQLLKKNKRNSGVLGAPCPHISGTHYV